MDGAVGLEAQLASRWWRAADNHGGARAEGATSTTRQAEPRPIGGTKGRAARDSPLACLSISLLSFTGAVLVRFRACAMRCDAAGRSVVSSSSAAVAGRKGVSECPVKNEHDNRMHKQRVETGRDYDIRAFGRCYALCPNGPQLNDARCRLSKARQNCSTSRNTIGLKFCSLVLSRSFFVPPRKSAPADKFLPLVCLFSLACLLGLALLTAAAAK